MTKDFPLFLCIPSSEVESWLKPDNIITFLPLPSTVNPVVFIKVGDVSEACSD